MPKIALAGKYVLDFLRQTSVARQHKTFRSRVSGNGRSRNKVGFKKPPKHSQFKKGRSGNPHGRPKEYDAVAERRQLRALLGLLKTRSDTGVPGTANPKSKHIKQSSSDKKLSPRELDVLLWLKEGKTYWEIGQILGISEHTVETHLRRARAKLNVATKEQAIAKTLTIRMMTSI